MTTHECDECGAEVRNKNAAGHYRSKCWPCIVDAAYFEGDDPKRPDPRPEDRV